MRRFSQRNSLVTLSDINITPLLDLAFVLLIIFVITTPLLEQGMTLRLPETGPKQEQKVDKEDVRTVEISATGAYMFAGQLMPLDQVEAALVEAYRTNPNLVVYVRADEDGPYKFVAAVLDRCERNGITRFSLRTKPLRQTP